MARRPRSASGFSLVELMIVLALLGILAGLAIPHASASIHDQLQSTAELITTDIAYARGLAVMNNSKYRLAFDLDANQYVLTHSGTNPALNKLPSSPFRLSSDPDDKQTVRLDDLPRIGIGARLHLVHTLASPAVNVTDLEFGPLGETTRSEGTTIWLAAGAGTATRYVAIEVNPITGLCTIGNYQAIAPTGASSTP